MFWFKKRRRAALRRQSLPLDWQVALRRNVPYYAYLPPEDQDELHGHIQVFIAEKNFEGCGGLIMTNEIRVTVAAHACLLLLHRNTDYYPRLDSILVYPEAFRVKTHKREIRIGISLWGLRLGGVHAEEVRVGESWAQGAVIIAWSDIEASLNGHGEGHNVILHEFAHQLDQENGAGDGLPEISDRGLLRDWARVMQTEYDRLVQDAERYRWTVIDDYGAESPSEFFAVVTECFFEIPLEIQRDHPELYDVLSRFYCQDPAELIRKCTRWTRNVYTDEPG